MLLAAVPDFLRAVSSSLGSIVGDPAHNQKGAAITRVLTLAASAIDSGQDVAQGLQELTTEIQKMTAEGREPSPDEWAELKKRSDDAHAALQTAAAPSPDEASAGSQKSE